MIKREELTNPDSCLSRAREDELIFVLLGRDVAAPAAIRAWVVERLGRGKNAPTDAQILEALACAEKMEAQLAMPKFVEIGKTYINGWGERRYIMGPHPQHDGVVWSLEGDHYRQADGRYVFFGSPTPLATRGDLLQAIPTPDHLAGIAEEFRQRGHTT